MLGQNVKVYCRVRPLLPSEKVAGARPCISISNNNDSAEEKPYIRVGDRSWGFDGVFDIYSKQQDVYNETVSPLVQSCLAGYNATILAYGQTGSGKTFTMGTANPHTSDLNTDGSVQDMHLRTQPSSLSIDLCESDGIIPRALRDLFRIIDSKRQSGVMVDVSVSYLEILNEEIRDLLAVEPSSKQVNVREDSYHRIIAQGSVMAKALTLNETLLLFTMGGTRRTTAGTLMNAASSRSHAIFTVFIDQHAHVDGRRVRSKFHLVDLAGSERLVRTGASGSRQRESAAINQGLLALSKVISALTVKIRADDTRHQHVPYRDSKLTRLLQDSLGGNSATCVVACISPADNSIGETVNTLKYASKARLIVNAPVVNEIDEEEILCEEHSNQNKIDESVENEYDDGENESEKREEGRGSGMFANMESMLVESQERFIQISSMLQSAITELRGGQLASGGESKATLEKILKVSEEGSQIYGMHKTNSKTGVGDERNLADRYLKLMKKCAAKDLEKTLLVQENKLLKDDLSRDEEIFAEKLREIRSLQNELFEMRNAEPTNKNENQGEVWKVEEIDEDDNVGDQNGLRVESPGRNDAIVSMEDSQPGEGKQRDIPRRQRKKWEVSQTSTSKHVSEGKDDDDSLYQRKKYEKNCLKAQIERELLNAESEISKLREDADEGEAALLDAQKEENEIRIKYENACENQTKEQKQSSTSSRILSENMIKLEHELKHHVDHANMLEQELSHVKNEKLRESVIDNKSREAGVDVIKEELKCILQAIKDHQRAIEGLESSGDEATQLVLKYRNRVVGLQQEVASLRSELLKESDAKLHQTANTSRSEVELSKQRTIKLKELLHMRTAELRTLALQENEQRKVISLKKDSDTRVLLLRKEIAILENQAEEKRKRMNILGSSDKSDKIEQIELKLQVCYSEIHSMEKQLKRYRFEYKESQTNNEEQVKKDNEFDIESQSNSLKQACQLVSRTRDACSVVGNAILELENLICSLKKQLIDIEEDMKQMEKEERRKEQGGYESKSEEGWREGSDNGSNEDNGVNESKYQDKENEIEEWFSRQLDKAERSTLELQRHSRNVFLREIAKKKWVHVEKERRSVLNSQNKLRESAEGIRNALHLRSSLEEVDATIRALDEQLAVTNKETSHIAAAGTNNKMSKLTGDNELAYHIAKLESLVVRREEALTIKAKLDREIYHNEGEGQEGSLSLQRINDELYALESEIELKDIEIKEWRNNETASSSQQSSDLNRASSILSEQVYKYIINEVNHLKLASSVHEDLLKCLYTASMNCIQSRMKLKDFDLMFEDMTAKLTEFENEISMLNLSLKTEKDNFNEISRKFKSVSFNFKRVRNERNQLRTFLTNSTRPNENVDKNLIFDGFDGRTAPQTQNMQGRTPGINISTDNQGKLPSPSESNDNVDNVVRKVRVSAKELKELSQLNMSTRRLSYAKGQKKQDMPALDQIVLSSSTSIGSGGLVSTAPSPPVRSAPPRPPMF